MTSGGFDTKRIPELAAGMSEDTRKAMTAAFDALSNWRAEIASASEKYGNAVFDKMGAAAKSLGWPAEYIDLTREQIQQASKMQVQMMDQVMDVWEQQLKAPSQPFKMPTFPGSSSMFPGFPGMGSFPSMPNMGDMDVSKLPPPMQFWMQAAEMWQKSWQQAMSQWMEAQSKAAGHGGSGSRGSR